MRMCLHAWVCVCDSMLESMGICEQACLHVCTRVVHTHEWYVKHEKNKTTSSSFQVSIRQIRKQEMRRKFRNKQALPSLPPTHVLRAFAVVGHLLDGHHLPGLQVPGLHRKHSAKVSNSQSYIFTSHRLYRNGIQIPFTICISSKTQ